MQKIKNSILDKMIAAQLTGKEIDFLLYVSRFQNDYGKVTGVHYKELCKAMHMSYQEFYNVKESLQEKGFIYCEKSNRIDHDITILNNSFLTREDINSGYINTNHNIFFSEKFYSLKAGAKLLTMHLMKVCHAGKGFFEIGVKKFYDKTEGYTKKFSVSVRVLRSYLMSIKEFFYVNIKDGKYFISPKKRVFKKPETKTENARWEEYNVEVFCRRNKIKDIDKKAKKDVSELLHIHKEDARRVERNIVELLEQSIEQSLQILNRDEKRIRKRRLNASLVHRVLLDELARLRKVKFGF